MFDLLLTFLIVLRFKWLSSLDITIVEGKEERVYSGKGTNKHIQNAINRG